MAVGIEYEQNQRGMGYEMTACKKPVENSIKGISMNIPEEYYC